MNNIQGLTWQGDKMEFTTIGYWVENHKDIGLITTSYWVENHNIHLGESEQLLFTE